MRARFCGTVEKKGKRKSGGKGQNERQNESRTREDEGDQRGRRRRRSRRESARGSRVYYLPTRFGPRRRAQSRVVPPSCSRPRPRNNVSGLWFFIRARSHNGGSGGLRSDPPVRNADRMPLFADETMEEEEEEKKEERREEDEQEEEVAFVPTSRAQLDAVCHFFTFPPLPFRASPLALSLPFSLFHLLSLCAPVTPPVALSSPYLSPLPRLYLSLFLSLPGYASSSTADALCLGETRLETPRGAILRRFRPLPS